MILNIQHGCVFVNMMDNLLLHLVSPVAPAERRHQHQLGYEDVTKSKATMLHHHDIMTMQLTYPDSTKCYLRKKGIQ